MLIGTATPLAAIREHHTDDTADLFRVLLNATSAAEAGLALRILEDLVPEKVLVHALNLREVLNELPASPFSMAVDEQTLIKTAGLTKLRLAAMGTTLPDGSGLIITTAGNLCLDIIVRIEGRSHYWSPIPILEDRISPTLVDHVIASEYLLAAVIELVECMGIVFNPKFYCSLEDWRLEYAGDAMESLEGLF
jgi:hypothetical protein